jgi:hypothetical protein
VKHLSILFWILIMTPLSGHAAATRPLPAHLTLRYAFAFDGWTIGRVTKTLTRGPHGLYQETMVAHAVGLARLLTHVVLADNGTFRIASGAVQPLSYVATRRGDSKAYRRHAIFSWQRQRLIFGTGQQVSIPAGAQDEESVFYAFMLHPLTKGVRDIAITNGATLTPYRFVYRGRERIRTPAGVFGTIEILRLNPAELRARNACRARPSPQVSRCLRHVTRFTIWVAPRLHDLAVRLRKTSGDRTLTITLTRMIGQP